MQRRLLSFLFAVILCALVGAAFLHAMPRIQSYVERRERENIVLPPPRKLTSQASSQSSSSRSSSLSSSAIVEQPLPRSSAVNWDVPFTPQAPFAVWDAVHEEACEEASILMVLRYFSGQTIDSPADAETAIQSLVARGAALGFTVDLTALQAQALILDQNPSLQVRLIDRPTADILMDELAKGALIIVPAAGQDLRNPYFQRPGPRYHMLVLRGYTDDGHVITNDPGTKRGEQFTYTWDRLLSSTHDWNDGDVVQGKAVVIVIQKGETRAK